MSILRAIIPPIALSLAATPIVAQPATSAQFKASAHIGPDTRDVTIRFSCAMDRTRINNLAVAIDIPAADKLGAVFSFDAFEGPTGITGHHHLAATGGAGKAEMDFGSTGSYGNNGSPATTFTFSAAMTPDAKGKANLAKSRAVVGALTSGPSHLSYTVENPVKGQTPIEAAVDLSAVDAARLATAMAPCVPMRAT